MPRQIATTRPAAPHSRALISSFLAKFLAVSGAVSVAMSGAGSLAWARETHFKDVALDLAGTDRLVISGLHGNIHLMPVAGSVKVGSMRVKKVGADKATGDERARFDSLSFNARRSGSALIIEERTLDSKVSLASALATAGPELDYEIEMPQIPIEISFRTGSVAIENWNQPVTVSLVKGTIHTNKTEGRLQVQIQHGDVKIESHRGKIEIDSYSAKLLMRNVEGPVESTNFSGETVLREAAGAFDIHAQTGPVWVGKSSGSVDFINGRGGFTLDGFEGPIRGNSDQGVVVANIEGEAEVHIDSNQGAVNVKLPSNSGATVRLQTDDGNLVVPAALASANRGKSVSGRLQGDGPKGSVAVKSKTGAVRIKL